VVLALLLGRFLPRHGAPRQMPGRRHPALSALLHRDRSRSYELLARRRGHNLPGPPELLAYMVLAWTLLVSDAAGGRRCWRARCKVEALRSRIVAGARLSSAEHFPA